MLKFITTNNPEPQFPQEVPDVLLDGAKRWENTISLWVRQGQSARLVRRYHGTELIVRVFQSVLTSGEMVDTGGCTLSTFIIVCKRGQPTLRFKRITSRWGQHVMLIDRDGTEIETLFKSW